MKHESRLRRLRAHMADRAHMANMANMEIEALLLTHAPDVRYLCGFTGSNAILLLLPRATVLLTDGRYSTQAREETRGTGVRVVIGKQLLRQASASILRAGVGRIGYDSNPSPVAALRAIKDADELRCMEEAASLGCRVFDAALPHLSAGVPERDIAAELEYAARRMGADAMSFETIVASGKRSALPHGHATGQPLPCRGFVTLDFGVMLRGYCSDMTRTVYLGKPTREEKAAYSAVLAAEEAGIAAVHAGATAAAVDNAARGVLRRSGLAKYFSHSTGHGVGLEIHEGPRLGAKVEDVLCEGMVLTIEPGVYLPGRFGLRIEDMVVVEANGARVLTPTPKALLTL